MREKRVPIATRRRDILVLNSEESIIRESMAKGASDYRSKEHPTVNRTGVKKQPKRGFEPVVVDCWQEVRSLKTLRAHHSSVSKG